MRAVCGGGGVSKRPALLLAAMIAIVDQISKWWITGPLDLPSRGQIDFLPIFRFQWVTNPCVSGGFLCATTPQGVWLLIALTSAIAVGVAIWLYRETNAVDMLALGAILGGALGNIADRFRFGAVVDFLNLHFGDWSPFLVFNAADAAITLGVVTLLARAFFGGAKKEEIDA